jgi:hypothetical protein
MSLVPSAKSNRLFPYGFAIETLGREKAATPVCQNYDFDN